MNSVCRYIQIHAQAKETVKHVNRYVMCVLIFQSLIEPMIYKTVDYEMYMHTRTYLFKAFL